MLCFVHKISLAEDTDSLCRLLFSKSALSVETLLGLTFESSRRVIMNSSLSEEQRRRIEENRKKALEKRAAAIKAKADAEASRPIPSAASNTFSSSISSSSSSSFYRPPNKPQSFFNNYNASSSTSNYANTNKNHVHSGSVSKTPNGVKPGSGSVSGNRFTSTSTSSSSIDSNFNRAQQYRSSHPQQSNTSNSNNGYGSSSNYQQQPQNGNPPPYNGPVVTGVCLMISRDRFLVDMGYHAQTVALFKTVEGSRYEPMKKKWSFPLAHHNEVIEHIKSLKPQVAVCPLPGFVTRIFRNAATTIRIPDVDLSPIDPVLVQALLPFQREGVRFGISRGGRVLIADDMGLGKTIQALGIAHYYYNDWPLLIATPSSMRYTWRDSIWNWLPSVPAGGVAVIESKQDSIYDAKVIIMSYDLLHKRAEEPPIKNCGAIIIDESHYIKNFKTARAKAAVPIIQNARRAILLSGTPALSRPIELYTQLTAISPLSRNVFPNFNDFGVRYCAGKKNVFGWDHSGSSNMEELQLVLDETIMIRRLKSDVLKQLPSKRRQMVMLDPKLVQKKKNEIFKMKALAFKEERQAKLQHGKLLEYFSETGRAKLEAVKNYVQELVETGRKFLCFAHHRDVLDGICEALEDIKCSHIRISGSTPSEDRQRLVDKFQQNDTCLVAVLSITAANTGITLTAASLVVFAELYWNPGILTQAEDRAHRIGQQDCVMVTYLVAKGTADDDIWDLVSNKLDVLNKAGLSKDNFREADEAVLHQAHQNQHDSNEPSSSQRQTGIQEFFRPSPSSQSTNQIDNQNSLSPLIGNGRHQIQNEHSKNKAVSNENYQHEDFCDPELMANLLEDTFDDADDEAFLSVPLPENDNDENNDIPLDAFDSPFDSQPEPNSQDDQIRNGQGDADEAMDEDPHGKSEVDLALEGDDSLFSDSNMEFMNKLEADPSSVRQSQKQMPGGFFLQDDEFLESESKKNSCFRTTNPSKSNVQFSNNNSLSCLKSNEKEQPRQQQNPSTIPPKKFKRAF